MLLPDTLWYSDARNSTKRPDHCFITQAVHNTVKDMYIDYNSGRSDHSSINITLRIT